MAKKPHYVLCKRELTTPEYFEIQTRISGEHSFASTFFRGRNVKYMDVEVKTRHDTRNASVMYTVVTVEQSSLKVVYGECPHAFMEGHDPLAEYKEEMEQGISTFEVRDCTTCEAILNDFPSMYDTAPLRNRINNVLSFRPLSAVAGTYSGRVIRDEDREYIAREFGNAITDRMRDVVKLGHREKPLEKIQALLIANISGEDKGDDSEVVFEIWKRGEGRVFMGHIRTEFHLAIIFDSLGIKYDW